MLVDALIGERKRNGFFTNPFFWSPLYKLPGRALLLHKLAKPPPHRTGGFTSGSLSTDNFVSGRRWLGLVAHLLAQPRDQLLFVKPLLERRPDAAQPRPEDANHIGEGGLAHDEVSLHPCRLSEA